MAKDVITRFKLETTQFDSKLRDTAKGLQNIAHQAEMGGKDFNNFSQKAIEAARALGTVQSGANNTKDKLRDLVGSYNDAAKAYNSLSETAKQGEFGKAMAASLQKLQQDIKDTKEELYSLGEVASGKGGGLFGEGGLTGMLQVFGGNLMTKAAGMAAGFAAELGDAVKQGVELAKQGEGIRIAFERLGRGDILQGLREATHGTVTDLELMKAAVKFNDFKLPVEELGTMLAFAQQKAKDTGQSVDYMVDSIVTGLGRKSLMILDNLGLSAAEIKEKMKETGDMTKAVGEIIREQMSKAGDYVETAADRAAQANVNLQNKMEELGRKFAPVEEASSQLWTSMKISILDIIGGPLATLLNQLTEAGRLKNMLNNMNGEPGSGNTKVDQQLKKLNVIKKGGGSDYIFNSTLNGMMEDYNRQIMALDAQIKNGGKRPGAGSGESQDVRYLQQKMDALKIMRDQLAAGAKEINKPIKIESNIPDVTGGGGGRSGGSTKNLPEYSDFSKLLFNNADQELKAKESFQSVWEMIGEEGRKQIAETLDKQWDYGKDISKEWKLDKNGNLTDKPSKGRGEESIAKDINKFTGYAGKMLGGVDGILGGISQLGIELPEGLQNILSGIEGIMSIASGIASILTIIQSFQEVQAASSIIPFYARGGVVHAAQGYVPGNNYSGDMVPALLNSGELVLNKAQQNSLANDLKGNGMQNLRLRTEVSGRNLVVVIENDLMARGKGQLATFK